MVIPKQAFVDNAHKDNIKEDFNAAADVTDADLQIRALFGNFSSDVSIVGFKYATNGSVSVWKRAVWIILLIGGFAYTIFNVYERIQYYLSYPEMIDIKVKDNGSVPFPVVTVCSENKFMKSKAEALGIDRILRDTRGGFLVRPAMSLQELQTEINKFSVDDWKSLYGNASNSMDSFLFAYFERKFLNVSNSEKVKIIWTNLGYCYSFNTGLEITNPGLDDGLTFILNASQGEYFTPSASMSIGAGYRILVHALGVSPLMNELAFKVSPGMHTQIGVNMEEIQELPAPYGDCRDNEGYTQSDCLLSCEARYVHEKCGCILPYMQDGSAPINRPICNPLQWKYCVDDAKVNFTTENQKSSCDCARECHRFQYNHDVSASQVSKSYKTSFRRSRESMEEDFTMVSIYMTKTSYISRSMNPAYTTLALFCDVGGALGLILGSTLLTFVEIVDFILSFIQNIYLRSLKRKVKSISKKDAVVSINDV